MEATKKGGFFKGKLAKSFARVTMPRATSHQQCGSSGSSGKVVSKVPTYSDASSETSMKKVSYASFKPPSFYDQNGYANDTWGHSDEDVDSKATSFISIVRERFKLDRVDSIGDKYQEMI